MDNWWNSFGGTLAASYWTGTRSIKDAGTVLWWRREHDGQNEKCGYSHSGAVSAGIVVLACGPSTEQMRCPVVQAVRNMMSDADEMVKFFEFSPAKQTVLENYVEEMFVDQKRTKLKKLCRTRTAWLPKDVHRSPACHSRNPRRPCWTAEHKETRVRQCIVIAEDSDRFFIPRDDYQRTQMSGRISAVWHDPCRRENWMLGERFSKRPLWEKPYKIQGTTLRRSTASCSATLPTLQSSLMLNQPNLGLLTDKQQGKQPVR